jgi:TatD DNase family protein
MMIDTHCHVDQYDDPEALAARAESDGILTVAVTNLPRHYQLASTNLRGFMHVRPALGLHPLAANEHEREIELFAQLANEAPFIGEVGLDFSSTGVASRNMQVASFRKVLSILKGKRKFVTVHSRSAEDMVLKCLSDASFGPVAFHWFSGSSTMLKRIVDEGHYISINPAMIATKKWVDCFRMIPRDRVLTETDGPFCRHAAKIAEPSTIRAVLDWIANQWLCSPKAAETIIADNFRIIPSRQGS